MRARRPWTPEEDTLLTLHVEINMKVGKDKLWNQVALNIPKRTNKDCRKRWMKLGAHLKKGSWTNEEDQQLQNAVNKVGCNWTLVAGILKTRHAEQCSKRWQYHLDPCIDHTRWDVDADNLLLKCYESHGRMWNLIKKEVFPRRSATNIKNRCNLLLRRRQRPSAPQSTKVGIPPRREPEPAWNQWKGPANIAYGYECLDEKDNRERNQNNNSDFSIQPYMDTSNRSCPQIFSARKSFYGHPRTTPVSMKNGYNDVNEDNWQKAPGIESSASSGVNHPTILAALLNQMRTQAPLPSLPWLDDYFPMSDPLWDGILTFEQTQTEDPSRFVQEN
ncbi:hypothetical protein V495_04771 [Pseudogymnoascus sp. VKM F-4514 (FW-929)]|nr:hypothetical protein V495_04771 [Pseudogymnoascus sp. VKM F-4514 (FW-929)]KFY58581.1 hypothetical protein V497_04764 [Pseudogymnoascus sp. VKM F-4516 (FW-969)]